MHLPLPTDKDGYEHYLCQEEIIVKQDNGLFAITNLGAILFARRLSDFRRLERKAIRVVQYADKSRMSIVKEQIFADGYAKALNLPYVMCSHYCQQQKTLMPCVLQLRVHFHCQQ